MTGLLESFPPEGRLGMSKNNTGVFYHEKRIRFFKIKKEPLLEVSQEASNTPPGDWCYRLFQETFRGNRCPLSESHKLIPTGLCSFSKEIEIEVGIVKDRVQQIVLRTILSQLVWSTGISKSKARGAGALNDKWRPLAFPTVSDQYRISEVWPQEVFQEVFKSDPKRFNEDPLPSQRWVINIELAKSDPKRFLGLDEIMEQENASVA